MYNRQTTRLATSLLAVTDLTLLTSNNCKAWQQATDLPVVSWGPSPLVWER